MLSATDTSSITQSAPEPGTRKGYTRGTHRVVSPSATIARAKALMADTGITRIANVTHLDTIGIPVVMVVRPNAKSLSVAQGKGLTLENAIASGLMEAIESYHAEQPTVPLKLATLARLQLSHAMIGLDGLPRYAGSSFHPQKRLLWTVGRSLHDGEARWLPYELVHTDYTLPLPSGSGTFLSSSSGLASGNHPFEAICHGLCELIERDAVTMWAHQTDEHRNKTRLDPASVRDEHCRALLDAYAQADIAVSLWDITSDIGVAAFKCTIMDAEANTQRPIGPMGGYGCHPSRAVALARALTEAAQSRLTTIAGARDDMQFHRLNQESYLQMYEAFHGRRGAPGPLKKMSEVPNRQHDNIEQDVGYVLHQLSGAGLNEAIAVDLTQPAMDIPVVRVVVPGLEPLFDVPGYTPGRRIMNLLASSEELFVKHLEIRRIDRRSAS